MREQRIFKFGRNSEDIRCYFQNELAHDKITKGKAKWFRVMKDEYPDSYYMGVGTGTGSSLW